MRRLRTGAALVVMLAWARAWAAPDNFGLGDGHFGPLSITTPGNIINSYAQVSSDVAAGATTISVPSTVGFAVNDLILVWQATGYAPAPASGDQTAIDLSASSVGRWELARVSALTATSFTVAAPMVNGFPAQFTQAVRVPEYTSVDVSGAGGIVAQPWNGATGGIVIFLASGTITSNGLISADSAGSRGGIFVNDDTSAYGCTSLDAPPNRGAQKGEGIAISRYGPANTGRGNVGNGGGGGICHNAGGGGGGNGGQGGVGGMTWFGDTGGARPMGGYGGAALAYSLLGHATLGGGGGAGQGNDRVATDGGRGGGMVFIRGAALSGTGTISADGGMGPIPNSYGNPPNNDGQGGGGAGGSIYLRFVGSVAGTLIAARGGNGQSTPFLRHGPGGGGGGGRVLLQAASIGCPVNVNAGVAGTQGDAAWPTGPSYGAGPTSASNPTSLGVIETAPPGGYCSANPDCPLGRPVCDLSSNSCTGCLMDLDCAGRPATPACNMATGACVVCTASNPSRCTSMGQVCRTSDRTCVQCLVNRDCPATAPVCDMATSACSPCTMDADCGGRLATPACNPTTGACVACTASNPALCTAMGQICNPSSSRCVQCLTSGDCPAANPVCNLATNLCVQCLSAGDCGSSLPVCSATNQCSGCTAHADCSGRPATPACDSTTGVCVQCTADNTSGCNISIPGGGCRMGMCVCSSDRDCASGRVCQGTCFDADGGVPSGDGGIGSRGAGFAGGGFGCAVGGMASGGGWWLPLAILVAAAARRRQRIGRRRTTYSGG